MENEIEKLLDIITLIHLLIVIPILNYETSKYHILTNNDFTVIISN